MRHVFCSGFAGMGVKNFTELRCWEQSAELKRRMYAICAREPACRDRDFCSQIKRAAASAPRNIAEGFARFNHREFKQFLRIARGSLAEIQDALIDAKDRGHIDEAEFKDIREISERAIASTTGLMKYLHETKDRRFWGED
jgi:four helix bundle protein